MQGVASASSTGIGRKVLRWAGRIGGTILALALLAAIIAASRETLTAREDFNRFPQQGRKEEVGGFSLNLNCTGEGGPAVILERGWSMPGARWVLLATLAARFS